MSSRDVILGRVREAIGSSRRPVEIPRGYRDLAPVADRIRLFVDRVADYKAEVTECRPDQVEDVIATILGSREVVVPRGFPYRVGSGLPDDGLTHQQLDEVAGVVSTATVGIAATGTIVLDHGDGQGRRALTLVPDLHVCVVLAGQVVDDVADAVRLLDPTRPQTWISGPSATSDIELNRVEGVHGPRVLHVVVVVD